MTRGRGRSGPIPNEEVHNRERSIQEVMIEDLQRQVAELTRHLATQNLDDRDSESSFENPYRNTVLGRKQRGRDERYGDFNFQVEFPNFSGTL